MSSERIYKDAGRENESENIPSIELVERARSKFANAALGAFRGRNISDKGAGWK